MIMDVLSFTGGTYVKALAVGYEYPNYFNPNKDPGMVCHSRKPLKLLD